jgi:hypothetical protein
MAALKCPNCGVTIAWVFSLQSGLGRDEDGVKQIEAMNCPECQKLLVQLVLYSPSGTDPRRVTVWPRSANRPPPPPEVTDAVLREDYLESCLVLQDSPKASAALSRRCLQYILREAARVKHGTLEKEIDEVMASHALPASIADNLDAVRHIGNFAAHPTKSQNTGEVMPVLPGEAEWNLDVVEALMDVYYVQPEKLKAKKAALNAKLTEAGKPLIP